MDKNKINVFSEIGRLKEVILHRPGGELDNLTPDTLHELLFDDIPFLEIAQAEHDAFAKLFQDNGVKVSYLEDLVAEALNDSAVKESFIDEFITEANIQVEAEKRFAKELFSSFKSNKDMVLKMMAGIRRSEVPNYTKTSLVDYMSTSLFVAKPMPNLYFTRDPFALMGSGISLNHMWSETRNRETLFGKYVFKYHDRFKNTDIPFWYNRECPYHIEGGDQLVLSKDVLAIGISQRTEAKAIEVFAETMFKNEANSFKTILAFQIPNKRAFMHLDTVFTMIDCDKFTIHPEIEGPLVVYSITSDGNNLKIVKEESTLEIILSKYLHVDNVKLIRCGGGDLIDAAKEQWNDGSNTLAIAPGEVIVYDRNIVTNKILSEDYGVKLHTIISGELSRGRGGPRCMSMPLYREDL